MTKILWIPTVIIAATLVMYFLYVNAPSLSEKEMYAQMKCLKEELFEILKVFSLKSKIDNAISKEFK
jgi:hypothetical protein